MYKRSQRHLEPQTLCVFVDARASPSSSFFVATDTTEVETLSKCENWSPPNTLALLSEWWVENRTRRQRERTSAEISAVANQEMPVQVGFGVIVYVFDHGSRSGIEMRAFALSVCSSAERWSVVARGRLLFALVLTFLLFLSVNPRFTISVCFYLQISVATSAFFYILLWSIHVCV